MMILGVMSVALLMIGAVNTGKMKVVALVSGGIGLACAIVPMQLFLEFGISFLNLLCGRSYSLEWCLGYAWGLICVYDCFKASKRTT